jgi:hypothetical protein
MTECVPHQANFNNDRPLYYVYERASNLSNVLSNNVESHRDRFKET